VALAPPKKILLIRLKAIGDVIMATPSIRALRKAFPSSEIHFLTRAVNEPLLLHNPYLNQIRLYPDKPASFKKMFDFFRDLRRERFDWVFDFEATPRSAWTALFTGAAARVGYAFRVRKWAFNYPVPKNKIRRFQGDICLSLIQFLGVRGDGSATEIFLGKDEKAWAEDYFSKNEIASQPLRLGINPTGTWSSKRWPVFYWRELIPLIHQNLGIKPLLFWGPGSEELVGEIIEGLEDFVIVKPETTLLEAAAFVSRLDLLVGSDGTPQHMAQALGVKSLTLWGPGWGIGWTLPNDPRHRFLQDPPPCGPCDKTLCPNPKEPRFGEPSYQECLTRITPAKVLRAIQEMTASPSQA
jgi:ADP-heptose:LPS heptosyltransferase